MDSSAIATCCDSGNPPAETGICGAVINSATVTCKGAITQTCGDYGVATYSARSCRAYCASLGDKDIVYDFDDGDDFETLSNVLVCDRALS